MNSKTMILAFGRWFSRNIYSNAKPVLVQVIGEGGRTPDQQVEADRATQRGEQVIEITAKDARVRRPEGAR